MPKDLNKPGQLDQEEVIGMLDDDDVICIDADGNEISIDEALAEPTDPDIYPPRAVQAHISAFESLQGQLNTIIRPGNGKKTAELSAKNPLTCFLDGMEVPVRKAVRIAYGRGTLTSTEIADLSPSIDVNLLNANISVAQAIEIAERPDVLTPSAAAIFKTFKEVNPNGTSVPVRHTVQTIQTRKILTDVELKLLQAPLIKIAEIWLEESLHSASKYTASGSHPEAIARMERRMADQFALTANVCLLENGHKEKERVSLAELIIIYEDAGLISAEDAVAQTEALTNKLTKLGLTPKDFQRKFESSKKNRIKDEDVQRRISVINETIDSRNEISHHVLNRATRTYEEVSIGNMIAGLFEELDLLPEDEKTFRTPLEIKYDSKLESLDLTREEVNTSIPTRLNHIDGEKPRSLSAFGVLRSEIDEAKKDPQGTFTTYVETAYGMEEVPILVAIALAVETQDIPEDLAKSLSRECENAMGTASQKSGSKITKSVISYHKTQAKLVWRRIKDRKNPPKKYLLPKAPSAADLLEAHVAASEGEMGNASFYPLKEILEARVAGKITREQAREFVERTVAACGRDSANSPVEAYSFVEWILRLHYISEALELLNLMPISEEDKRDARKLLSDETPSAASTPADPADSDKFSVYDWRQGQGFTSSLSELDKDDEIIRKDFQRTAILASLRKTAKSPLSIILTTTAAVMLLSHVAIKVSKKAGLEGENNRMETYEQGPNGETIIKDEAGSIIAVYPPEPEDISFPVIVQTSTPLPEPATSYASATPDTPTGKPDTFSAELMTSPTIQSPPIQIAQPQIEKPAPLTLTPEEQAAVIETAQASLNSISTGARAAGSNLSSWMQSRIDRTRAGIENLRTQISQWQQKEVTDLADRVAEMRQQQIEALELAMKPQTSPRQKETGVQPYERRAIESNLSPLPRLAETESRQSRRTELAQVQPPQIDAETVMAVQETIRSMTAKISQTAKSLTNSAISWIKTQSDTVKAGLEKLSIQIAEMHRREARELAELAMKPQTSPRQKETNAIQLYGRRAIETVLTALPPEPPQVALATPPSPQEQPAAVQPIEPAAQPSPEVQAPSPSVESQTPSVQPSTETPETREMQIPIATTKTATGFTIDPAKSYALWKERGWQGAFLRRAEGASFVIIIPDKKTGKSYKVEIPTTYASAQKTVTSTASLVKK